MSMNSILIQVSEKILWEEFQSIQLYQVSATEYTLVPWHSVDIYYPKWFHLNHVATNFEEPLQTICW